MEDHSQGRLRGMYLHLVVLTFTGWPAVIDGLDGDLARLQQWLRGRMALFAHARRLRRPAGAASCPGFRASAAAVVRSRGKASGRGVVHGHLLEGDKRAAAESISRALFGG